ncbi:X2-like carbohydrate binding domain-containing protein [Paenibacillus sacheonensis]|uniref:Alpha-galactosidase n=1 Tax=Paenibacillus sacheonensis TaxID=742054 RepID=A0A7X5BXY9_9BACL|nr:X2-like carbohydrate binding domain-containing protein [Paenibacillus sacheonensis]MBM7567056.1 hypothetical protein [Paenibacillus sacheonensis]NBC71013.1 hypothetical protein [Paenibacillus sacheonensis]
MIRNNNRSTSKRKLVQKIGTGLLLTAVAVAQFGFVPAKHVAEAADNGLALKPYMGWSSYSLQVYDGPSGNWVSAAKLKQQSDAMHEKLQSHGYEYINIDAGWNGDNDQYGRPIPSTTQYPDGLQDVIDYIHHNGQKVGIYMIPSLSPQAYKDNLEIFGTDGKCHMKDIALPNRQGDYWGLGYKIDFESPESKDCAQAYVDSVVDMIASWGIDFVKFDSVTPGSGHNDLSIDARADVAAWSKALSEHKIWFELSWALDHNYADYWKKYANGWRVDWDVESYDPKIGMTQWENIARLFPDAALWWRDAGPGGWNDFDSLNVGNGAMDGLTKDERQSAMTLWAMSSAQLYTGDDLTKLDSYGLSLLTNDEVIGVNQAGHPAHPLSMATTNQVWYANNGDGTYTVALFNLGDKKDADVSVDWSDIGLSGGATVRDLWSHTDLGSFAKGFTATELGSHASRLLKVTANGGASSGVNDDDTGMRYTGDWTRNGGKEVAPSSQDLEIALSDSSVQGLTVDGDEDGSTENGGSDDNGEENVEENGDAPNGSDAVAMLAEAGHTVTINDNDPGIVYTGDWHHSFDRSSLEDWNHDVHFAQADGSQLTYSFTGTGIDYVTEKEKEQGSIDFYIDDAFQETVDTQKSDPREVQQTVYSATGLTSGRHTLKAVKHTDAPNDYMLIDALKVTADTLLGTTSATFDNAAPADVTTTLPFGASSLAGIKNGAATLVKDTDYAVSGSTVAIKAAYLSQQPQGAANLSFAFAGGDSQTLAVTITGQAVRNSTISPTSAAFDLKVTKQADVTTTLTLNDNALNSVSNGAAALTAGTDYAVNGSVLTIKKAYLAKQAVGSLPLTITFSAGQPQTLTIAISDTTAEGRYANINNDDPSIHYDGSWTLSRGRKLGDYMDDVQFAEKNGDSFSYTFRGTGIKVVTEMDESQGEMDILVDGVLKATVDTHHNGRLAQQTVYEINGLSNSQHTIKAIKKSGSYMLLDMLKVRIPDLIGPTVAAFDKNPDAQADLTVTLLENVGSFRGITNGADALTAGTDYTVSGDKVTINKSYLSTLPASGVAKLTFSFDGDFWQDVHTTATDGDYYTYTFRGTGIEVLSPKGPSQGDVEIFIDGVSKGTVNANGADRTVGQRLYGIDGLPGGEHTIKVVKVSGDEMYADRLNFIVADSGTTTGPGSSYPPVTGGTEVIKGEVNGSGGTEGVLQLDITRTTASDGTKSDSVTLGSDAAKEAIAKLKAAGAKAATIVVPDEKGVTSATNVTIPKESSQALAGSGLDLGIETANGGIVIPNASLAGYDGEAAFTFKPIKDAAAKGQLEDRAGGAAVVKLATGGSEVSIVGQPVSIETNFQGRAVDVIVPVDAALLAGLQPGQLGVYIEHGDGTTEYKTGTIVEWQGGKGLRFTVDKFSTFAVVKHDAVSSGSHTAYMNGFEGGLFKPANNLTRAEMAAILSRIITRDGTGDAIAYRDVKPGHWAAGAIAKVTKLGLMQGFGDGVFKPDQAITRAEMASLAAAIAKSGAKDGAGFSDTHGSWAEAAIAQVQGAGIIRGYADGTFRPAHAVTRAEAAAILNRTLGRGPLYGDAKLPWTDVKSGYWAYGDIAEASVNHSYAARSEGGEQFVPEK